VSQQGRGPKKSKMRQISRARLSRRLRSMLPATGRRGEFPTTVPKTGTCGQTGPAASIFVPILKGLAIKPHPPALARGRADRIGKQDEFGAWNIFAAETVS
jgi:hypothetical protein